jgi:predicted nucleic acid-binding protein
VSRVLLDLNVVLDVLLDRAPHAAAAARLWAAVEEKKVEGFLPAHGFTTVFYLAARHRDAAYARRILDGLVTVFAVASVDASVVRRALGLGLPDFEDAVCVAAAEAAGCDLVVTRDPRGFARSPLRVVDPTTALAILAASGAKP